MSDHPEALDHHARVAVNAVGGVPLSGLMPAQLARFDPQERPDPIESARHAERLIMKRTRLCPEHGEWHPSHFDADGVERVVPGCPACAQARQENALLGNVPLRFRGAAFSTFYAETAVMQDAATLLEQFAADAADGADRNAVIVGQPGTGKTHLGVSIARRVAAAGHRAVYARIDQLAEAMIRRSRNAEGWREESSIAPDVDCEHALNGQVLVIDEIGRFQLSQPQSAALFRVIDHRYGMRLPTVIISNVADLNELKASITPAGFDRIRGGNALIVVAKWDSYRFKDGAA